MLRTLAYRPPYVTVSFTLFLLMCNLWTIALARFPDASFFRDRDALVQLYLQHPDVVLEGDNYWYANNPSFIAGVHRVNPQQAARLVSQIEARFAEVPAPDAWVQLPRRFDAAPGAGVSSAGARFKALAHKLMLANGKYRFALKAHAFEPINLITYLFFHANWFHLLMNGFMFVLFVETLEYWVRRRWLFGAFFWGGVFAGVAYLVVLPSAANRFLIGFSGSVFVVMGMYFFYYVMPRLQSRGRDFLVASAPPGWPIAVALMLYLLELVVLKIWVEPAGAASSMPGIAIAHVAHGAGFLFGLGVAAMTYRKGLYPLNPLLANPRCLRESAWLEARPPVPREEAPIKQSAQKARRRPDEATVLAAYWEQACAADEPFYLAESGTFLFDHLIARQSWREALTVWEELDRLVPGYRLPTRSLCELIEGLAGAGYSESARTILEKTRPKFLDKERVARVLLNRTEQAVFGNGN
ncbi:rhomboid family intramembrane serine protease [Acanthopleuribacter pedis]